MDVKPLKILAIDDKKDNLLSLKALLQESLPGSTLLTALNGPAGIALARAEDPDVILLDIVMPGMDGFEVCRQLKADDAVREIPVVFLTALRTDRAHRISALEVGAEAFLSKPIDELELMAQVRAMGKIKAHNRMMRREKEQLVVRHETILEVALDGFWLVDAEGRLLEVNAAYSHMSGYSVQELLAMRVSDLEALEAPPEILAHLQKVMARGWDRFESKHRRKDGSVFDVQVSVKHVAGVDGQFVCFLQDITARKQVEKALERSQDLLKQAEKLGRVGGWEFDIETQQLTWTDMVFEIHELDAKEPGTVEQGINYYTPASRPVIAAAVQRAIEWGEPYDVELEIVTAKGNLRSVHAIGMRDEAGLRVSGFFQDITERKQAEATLRRRNVLLSALINSPSDLVIFSLDRNYCYTAFNEKHRQEMRAIWQTDIQIGTSLLECMADVGLRALAKQSIDRALGGEIFTEIQHQPGANIYYELVWNPIREGVDRIEGVTAFIRDVTARMHAELALQRFRMLADSSSEFIGMCDLDMTPIFVNPAGLAMVGLRDVASACQVNVRDYFFPEDQRFMGEEFFPRVLREGHGDVEIRLRHFQTGEPIWVFYYLFSIRDASGEIIGWATTSRNITESKRAAELLEQQAEELRVRNEDLLRFNRVAVGRELRMVELKRNVNELCGKLGEPPRFAVPEFEDTVPALTDADV